MKKKQLLKKDFGKNLIKKIKQDKVKQVSKSVFILKHFSVFFFLVLSIFLGALSLSIIFEYLNNADWTLLNRLGFLKIFIIFMPIFWLLFLILASFFSYYNFKHTEKGYKFSIKKIISINIILSLLLAIFLYYSGINAYIESKLETKIPNYRSLLVKDNNIRMFKIWQNEEEGLLIGKIINVGDNSFTFIDYNNKEWNILLGDSINIKASVDIQNGEMIKIIGKKLNDNEFEAIEIRPFKGKNARGK